ncbi:universal stress protein [Streptomyces zhihengii]
MVGNRGLGGFGTLMLGSVGLDVLAHARRPVVIVRESPPAAWRRSSWPRCGTRATPTGCASRPGRRNCAMPR